MNRIVVLLLLLPLLATAAEDSLDTCAKNNQFLSLLTSEAVTVDIFNKPEINTEAKVCGHEWRDYGTCCDHHELLILYEYERAVINRNAKEISNTLSRIGRVLKPLGFDDNSTKSGIMANMYQSFKESSNVCWTRIIKIRGSALCSICSGRSSNYFDSSKKKAFISPDTCRSAVKACKSYFGKLDWLLSNVKTAVEEVKAKKDVNSIVRMLKYSNRLKKFTPPREILEAFREYALGVDQSLPSLHGIDGLRSAKVCSTFLNIRNKPYVCLKDSRGKFTIETATINAKYKDLFLATTRSKKVSLSGAGIYGKTWPSR
jgi:hypothetical protein